MINLELFEAMKKYRIRSGLSSKRVAELLQIDASALSKYEQGKLNLSISMFASMSFIYQIPPRDLLHIILTSANRSVIEELKTTEQFAPYLYEKDYDTPSSIGRLTNFYELASIEDQKKMNDILHNILDLLEQ